MPCGSRVQAGEWQQDSGWRVRVSRRGGVFKRVEGMLAGLVVQCGPPLIRH